MAITCHEVIAMLTALRQDNEFEIRRLIGLLNAGTSYPSLVLHAVTVGRTRNLQGCPRRPG